ncbi:ABC-2 type transport system ATP-binding protein [Pseudomonas cuatrocienegasensis]|uniref:ABC-2 type transport system ATP-binding protein n=1 Tax=Pseudomonas cuatrocienegasensis TaxID=543360 RepID=A0ABY1B5Y4_9PSED|nr:MULTISPECIES: ABC transporter ATP-binding protein [Pseudomonas]OEC36663.1 ABC transporter [Pseudomonas sp. 21C1]SEQ02554.1 ABC-2 type transport system ATP-binding protein [Pseudomonas cuatrocienegasensis]
MSLVCNSDAVIEVRGLAKRYADHQVLDDLSLRVEPGSILGLVGRNGAGKSTLLRCMLGLLRADKGQAFVQGRDALRLDDQAKSALSYVPQQPDSFPWMTVGAMLDFVGSLYPNWDADLVKRLLDRWELSRARQLNKLSPGERQQVALIRALGSRPQLLVLDEPAAALDPVARRELLREIVGSAAEQGATVILSTHIISDLERIASEVAFLHQGRLLLQAGLDELKDEVRRIVLPADVNLPQERLRGEVMRHRLSDGGYSVLLRLADGSASLLPGKYQAQTLGLEDLFLELVR